MARWVVPRLLPAYALFRWDRLILPQEGAGEPKSLVLAGDFRFGHLDPLDGPVFDLEVPVTRSTHALARWLMKEVHGIDIGRKPPERARSAKGPARSWRYRAWIRTLPCAVCGAEYGVEAAHTGADGGLRQKASDYSCVPLCSDHHTAAADSYHRLGREEFARRHDVDLKSLIRSLHHCWFAYSREVK